MAWGYGQGMNQYQAMRLAFWFIAALVMACIIYGVIR